MNAPPPDALPDAEQLLTELIRQLKPAVSHAAGMVGIATGGVWLAERLHAALGLRAPLGVLDVSFYRDDVNERGMKPTAGPSNIPFDVDGRDILLVDDVLFTGRTVRAAMNELFDYGRPARVDLAVLADRGGRELPIEANYLGGKVQVPKGQILMLERAPEGAFSLRISDKRRERRSGA
jgi:pyrimidine operon attenuation protein / uracil phosphoribosyltransferase